MARLAKSCLHLPQIVNCISLIPREISPSWNPYMVSTTARSFHVRHSLLEVPLPSLRLCQARSFSTTMHDDEPLTSVETTGNTSSRLLVFSTRIRYGWPRQDGMPRSSFIDLAATLQAVIAGSRNPSLLYLWQPIPKSSPLSYILSRTVLCCSLRGETPRSCTITLGKRRIFRLRQPWNCDCSEVRTSPLTRMLGSLSRRRPWL